MIIAMCKRVCIKKTSKNMHKFNIKNIIFFKKKKIFYFVNATRKRHENALKTFTTPFKV